MNISEKIKDEFKKLGKQIRKIREEKEISIDELSEKTGIRKEYLKKIESGNAHGIKLNTHLYKIANALEIKFSAMFDYKNNK